MPLLVSWKRISAANDFLLEPFNLANQFPAPCELLFPAISFFLAFFLSFSSPAISSDCIVVSGIRTVVERASLSSSARREKRKNLPFFVTF